MALPPRLFCDTSFFYACLDRADANHDRARALAEDAAASRAGLWTTWDVVSETATLLRYRGSFRTALTFLDDVKPRLHVVRYGDRVRDEAEQVFRRYGRAHRLSCATRSPSSSSRRCSAACPASPSTKTSGGSA